MNQGRVRNPQWDPRVKYKPTPEKLKKFRTMYMSGVLFKSMAEELQVPTYTLQHQWRKQLELPPRKKAVGVLRPHTVSMMVDDAELELLRKRAHALGAPISGYLRSLFLLDVERNGHTLNEV